MTNPEAIVSASDIVITRMKSLHDRGYQSKIILSVSGSMNCVHFEHPSCSKKQYIPKLALWSDGVLSTNGLLWPQHYVPSERVAPPAWQKAIAAQDAATFQGFAASIGRPGFVDLKVRPIWRSIQRLSFRLLFGASLSLTLALPTKLAASAIGLTP